MRNIRRSQALPCVNYNFVNGPMGDELHAAVRRVSLGTYGTGESGRRYSAGSSAAGEE